nr:MFS transporter [Allostreptomyces psammosilenae]
MRPPTPSSPEPDPRRWWSLAVIAFAQLIVVLDATIVNVALPSAQADLGISDADRSWVITAYTLAFGGLLLLGGRISDMIGRRRSFLIGLVGFAVASGLGGAAASIGPFLAARAGQGVFAALLAPAAMSLLSTTFTNPRERATAFGVYGAVGAGGSAIGLIAGGALTEYLDWRWCLFVNIPIAAIAIAGTVFVLRDHGLPSEGTRRRLDLLGVVLGCGGVLVMVYGFSEAESRSWGDRLVLALLGGSVVLLTLFALWQRRASSPLLPLRIITERNRAGAFLTVGLANVGSWGLFLFMTYYLQEVLGYSALRTGLSFVPLTIAIIIGATQIAARLFGRVQPRWVLVPGLLLQAAGLGILTQLTPEPAYLTHVLPAELVLGLGLGLVTMPAMNLVTQGVETRDSGVASATANTSQQLGGSIGTALLNTIATSATAGYVTAHAAAPEAEATVHGFTVAITWAVGILLVAAVLATLLVNVRVPRSGGRGTGTGARTAAEAAPQPQVAV